MVKIDSATGKLHIGIVVDSVSEVINIRGVDEEDTPTFGAALSTDYIPGMAKTAGSIKILLNIDKVLSTDELDLHQEVA